MKTFSEMKAALPKRESSYSDLPTRPVTGHSWDREDLKALLSDETGEKVDLESEHWKNVELPWLRYKTRGHPLECTCIDCCTLDAWDRNDDGAEASAKLAQLGPCGRESHFYPGFKCIKPLGHTGTCTMEEVSDGIKTTISVPDEPIDTELEESLTNAASLLGRVNDMFEFIGRTKLKRLVTHKELMIIDELANDVSCFLNDQEKE